MNQSTAITIISRKIIRDTVAFRLLSCTMSAAVAKERQIYILVSPLAQQPIWIYVSKKPFVRQTAEVAGCIHAKLSHRISTIGIA